MDSSETIAEGATNVGENKIVRTQISTDVECAVSQMIRTEYVHAQSNMISGISLESTRHELRRKMKLIVL